jgi:hypothetical protein
VDRGCKGYLNQEAGLFARYRISLAMFYTEQGKYHDKSAEMVRIALEQPSTRLGRFTSRRIYLLIGPQAGVTMFPNGTA